MTSREIGGLAAELVTKGGDGAVFLAEYTDFHKNTAISFTLEFGRDILVRVERFRFSFSVLWVLS